MRKILIFLVFSLLIPTVSQAQSCIVATNPDYGQVLLCDVSLGDRECLLANDGSHFLCSSQPGEVLPASNNSPQPQPQPQPVTVTGVPQWQSLPEGGVQAAAFCLTKDHDGPIKDKSFSPPSTCALMVAKNPFVAVLTEHQLGNAAIFFACSNFEYDGIPIGTMSAADALLTCQCHNPSAQATILRDWPQVEASLKQWGGNCP